jgi:Predicted oxidoreductases (related to aryl-alcohol dehydrogenases)
MQYKKIYGTDLNTSAICLGTAMIGSAIDQETSYLLLDKYLEMGGNFIDTAHVYADWIPGEKSCSEKTIGRWMRERGIRNNVIIGTKCGHKLLSGEIVLRMSRKEISQDLNESLEYLQTDHIDLYWLHRDDPNRPVADILETLNGLVESKKIRYFGCSNWKVQRMREAMEYSYTHDLKFFSANQMMWSLAEVNHGTVGDETMVLMDQEGMEFHKETGLVAIPYSSQAQGFYTKMDVTDDSRLGEYIKKLYNNEKNIIRLNKLKKLSQDLSVPIAEIVLGYLTAQPFVTIPIVGCRTVEQLTESMKAGDLVLEQEVLEYLY